MLTYWSVFDFNTSQEEELAAAAAQASAALAPEGLPADGESKHFEEPAAATIPSLSEGEQGAAPTVDDKALEQDEQEPATNEDVAPVVDKPVRLSISHTPEFMQLPLEYQGFCSWTVLHRRGE